MNTLGELREDADGWYFDVAAPVASPWGALHGGAALGAAVEVAAAVTGTTVRWASTRFLATPVIDDRVRLRVRTDAEGRRTSHVTVGAFVGDDLAFDTMLVVGEGDRRPSALHDHWMAMPSVPAPADAPVVPESSRFDGFALGRFERRVALGPHPAVSKERGPGRVAAWTRLPGGDTTSPVALAWIADCLVTAVRQVIGSFSRAASLDNTIRYGPRVASEWVLVSITAQAAADGYVYGDVHLFADDGTLVATGSQTCFIRPDDP